MKYRNFTIAVKTYAGGEFSCSVKDKGMRRGDSLNIEESEFTYKTREEAIEAAKSLIDSYYENIK